MKNKNSHKFYTGGQIKEIFRLADMKPDSEVQTKVRKLLNEAAKLFIVEFGLNSIESNVCVGKKLTALKNSIKPFVHSYQQSELLISGLNPDDELALFTELKISAKQLSLPPKRFFSLIEKLDSVISTLRELDDLQKCVIHALKKERSGRGYKGMVARQNLVENLIDIWVNVFAKKRTVTTDPLTGKSKGPLVDYLGYCLKCLRSKCKYNPELIKELSPSPDVLGLQIAQKNKKRKLKLKEQSKENN